MLHRLARLAVNPARSCPFATATARAVPRTSVAIQTASRFSNLNGFRGARMYTQPTLRQQNNATGILNWRTLAVFTATGAGLLYYFRQEKARIEVAKEEERRLARENTIIGKPKIGGPFTLVDQHGVTTTEGDFLGRYMLLYFGFTNCPDICPEELDKMAEVLDTMAKDPEVGDVITPIFITCDPQRDTVEEVREYVQDFHKDLVGLTGPMEEIAKVARAYRVYFSKPPKVSPGEDYLVDHSIFFYLMSPTGEFVDCYAKDQTAEVVSESVKKHILAYVADGGKIEKQLRPRAAASAPSA
ncbi:Cu-binding protein [Actinomortierella ambigua]|uniref:Cu-binding protein n=1 Tax=Actinomortierella ambigua TaxID=1343610 RepID=A0A9P6QJH5_9FUNG|nr:Cu-binding protein [Actinomortierella ambigua]KAG0266965.1 Cu-binding protein [Actinomortierella ambigua]